MRQRMVHGRIQRLAWGGPDERHSSHAAHACAVCGGAEDNGYFWGVLFLMSMPFAIGSFIGGWLLYSYRRAPSDPATSTPTPAIEGRTPRPASALSASERPDDGH